MLVIKKIVHNRLFIHGLLWAVSYFFLLHYFSISQDITRIDYIFSTLFHIPILCAVYINLYIFIPRIINKRWNFWKYLLSLIVLFFLFYGIQVLTFDYVADLLFPNYYLIYVYDYNELLKFFLAYLGLSSLLEYGKSGIDLIRSERGLIQDMLKALKVYTKKFIQNRFFLHVLFWVISFYILLQHFSISQKITNVDYLFTTLFHVSILCAVYINLYFLIPRFLNKQNYLKYIFSLMALFGLFYGIHVFTFDVLSELIFPNYYLIVFYDYIELLKYFAVYLGLTSLFFLSKSWIDLADSKKKLVEKEKELIYNELKALKAQVNPHFLFNSLNSIYALAIQKSDQAPEVILKLSNVLRYMIYESNEHEVDLNKEIDFIKNYIDLQKLRTKNPDTITLNINGEIKEQKLAPLILIVFIENAFKHGVKGDTVNQFIRINITVSDTEIHFFSENNIGIVDETENNEYSGLGLENVKRRLELLYHENHELKLSETSDTFIVELKILL